MESAVIAEMNPEEEAFQESGKNTEKSLEGV